MTPDQMAELAARLHDFGKAYPVEIFPEITDEERAEHSRLITRAAAQMGRHFAKFAVPAADLIAGMAQQSGRHVALVCPQCSWTLEEREPLSEEQIMSLYDGQPQEDADMMIFARAIEQAHGISSEDAA